MEKLSQDLNLALDESNSNKNERKKFGLRRRTRSTGNLPAYCLTGPTEDGSSSSPPQQQPIVSQALSDSDDLQSNNLQNANFRTSKARPINLESDSFNENFSPTKPPNARRKRKFKKMAIDCPDNDKISTSLIGISQIQFTETPLVTIQNPSQLCLMNKKKRIFKHTPDRSNLFCGKRKWSHRDRNESSEMRERSFSGGCSSKSHYFSKSVSKTYYDFKNAKKPSFKEKFAIPAKSTTVKCGLENAMQNINLSLSANQSLPGSSKFNFVFRKPILTNEDISSPNSKSNTELPMFIIPAPSDQRTSTKFLKKKEKANKKFEISPLNQDQLRNPLLFDEMNTGMDCSNDNGHISSSSLSSSDSEGVITNDSDREGDDELTDWPGNDEISSFSKTLTFKNNRSTGNNGFKFNNSASNKSFVKKDKYSSKSGQNNAKNKTDILKTDGVNNTTDDLQLMDDDTIMSDSGSLQTAFACTVTRSNSDPIGPSLPCGFTTFGDIKNAGLSNNNINEPFYQSYQSFQETASSNIFQEMKKFTPRTNFSLQKTSSSDLNLSEKSPQSDHCYSDHSVCFGATEIREIRAGCRRVGDTRPGFTIVCVANEQLSKFLRDPCRNELKLPCFNNDPVEKEKLVSLAKLYSLDLRIELGCPILRKTVDTTQAVRVDQTRICKYNHGSEFKRRCYDDDFEDSNLQLNRNLCNTERLKTTDFPIGNQYSTVPNGSLQFYPTDEAIDILPPSAANNSEAESGQMFDIE